jgi:antitoxin YefM
MKTKTYTHLRANLAQSMEEVCDDHVPTIITRQNAKPVVMMSLEDYRSLEETSYLLRSPANARRLSESIADIDAGNADEKALME